MDHISGYFREPAAGDVLCKNCRHSFSEHDPDGFACHGDMDDEADSVCTCTFYEPWDSQPVEVYIPDDASLEELIALRKAA